MKGKRAEGTAKERRLSLRSAWSRMELLRKKDRRAFTLAEVLIVVAIIATLTAVAIPVFRGQLEKNRDSVTATNLRAAYDEATAAYLASGVGATLSTEKPEAAFQVDGVVFETTDVSLSGEEANLPFVINGEIPPKQTKSVVFHFKKDHSVYMTIGEDGTAIDGIPDIPTVNDPEVWTLTGITIGGTPKTTYFVGESFSTADMLVTATYKNGDKSKTSTVTGYSFSPSGALKATDTKVTVSYTEGGVTKTKDLSITVSKRTLSSISLACSDAFKSDYYVGESFSPANMVVTAHYNDGSSAAVLGYSCMPSGPYTASGAVEVTVSYTEGDVTKTDKLNITVKKTLDSITIEDVKTEYNPGDVLDLSDMKVWAHYKGSDPDEEVTAQASITDRPDEPLEPGKHQLKVSYTEEGITKTATLEITVGKAIRAIAITTPPTKLVYVEGERFDPTDMVVTVTYIDDTFDTIEDTNVFTYTPAGRLTADVENVTVVYKYGDENWKVEQRITVKAIEKIEIKIKIDDEPVTVEPYVCDAGDFDLTAFLEKMTVWVTYVGESTPDRVEDEDYDRNVPVELGGTPPKAGDYTLTVAYPKDAGEYAKNATQSIRITKKLKDLEISIPTPYHAGDVFDQSNMQVTAVYTDGRYPNVTGFTVDAAALNPAPVDGKLVEGITYTVPVTYTNPDDNTDKITKNAEFTVGEAVLNYIKITTPPQNTQLEGYAFDPAGMVVTAYYTDGTHKPLSVGDYTIEAPTGELQDVGECEVKVSYTEGEGANAITKPATCTITVKSITALVIEGVETTYDAKYFAENHEAILLDENVKVKAVYNDGTSESVNPDVAPHFTSVVSGKPLEGAQFTVTAAYKGANASHKITITKKLDYIEITGTYEKVYYVGDTLNPEGMEVTAHYTDGSYKENITGYTCDPNTTTELTTSNTSVTISYEEGGETAEATVDITVKEPTLVNVRIDDDTQVKKTCYVGQEFEKGELTLRLIYDHGDPETITTQDYEPVDNAGPYTNGGDYEMSIKYKEVTAQDKITIKVAILYRIEIIEEPQMSYSYNRYNTSYATFNKTGLKVKAYYTEADIFQPRVIDDISKLETDPYHGEHLVAPDDQTATKELKVTYAEGTNPISVLCSHQITIRNYYDNGGCFATGTLITLADGSQKPVEELSFGDMLLVWDFKAGTYAEQPALALINHGKDTYSVANLLFSDDTMLRVIVVHGVFDYDLNRFVYISPKNAEDYIGHRFVKCAPDGGYDLVTLVSTEVTEEETEAWSIVSAYDYNAFASDLLTLTPTPTGGRFDFMPMGETLRYDTELFQQLVAQYGIYDYEVFAQYLTEEQIEAFNGRYMKVFVDTGVVSLDELREMAKFISDFVD